VIALGTILVIALFFLLFLAAVVVVLYGLDLNLNDTEILEAIVKLYLCCEFVTSQGLQAVC
jgi:hypothetical protein